MIRSTAVIVLAHVSFLMHVPAMEFSIIASGALAGSDFDNTSAIQRTIDACASAGGGRVLVPPGVFKTYTFSLKSNVELHLMPGAVLLGGEDGSRYPFFGKTPLWHVERAPRCPRALIYTCGQTNVSITGTGVIDGNAARFHERVNGRWRRISHTNITARCVFFACCRNVRLSDATIRRPSGWSTFFLDCDDVSVRRLRIKCDRDFPNGDGLHFGACRDVVVTDCDIDAADDAIVVRNHQELTVGTHVSARLAFSNCVLRSNQAAVRIGWHADGPIRDVSFDRIDCDYSRIGIQFVLPPVRPIETDPPRGSGIMTPPLAERLPFSIENIRFSDFSIVSHYAPLYVKVGRTERVDFIRHVAFERGVFRAFRQPVFECRPEDGVTNWRFTDVTFDIKKPRAPTPTRSDYGVSGGERTFMENLSDVMLENVRWRSGVRDVPEWYLVFSQEGSGVPVIVEGAWQDVSETLLPDGTRRLQSSTLSDGQTTWSIGVTVEERKNGDETRFRVLIDNRDPELIIKKFEGPYCERMHVDLADVRLAVGSGNTRCLHAKLPEPTPDVFCPGVLLPASEIVLASEGKMLSAVASSSDVRMRLRHDKCDDFVSCAPVWDVKKLELGETCTLPEIRYVQQNDIGDLSK